MAGFDDDDFDLGSDDGFGDIEDAFNSTDTSDSASDFGEFGGQAQTASEVSQGKNSVIKQAIIIGIIGIIVIALAFGITKWLTGGSKPPKEEVTNTNQSANTLQQGQSTPDSWIKFNEADKLSFTENYISSVFTVTAINNYVKIVDSEKNLMVKTVLTGTLSGFIGTYELEIPYSKGCQLSIGNYFNVEVQVGESNKKVIVGEIKY